MLKELRIYQSITPRDSQSLKQYFADVNSTHPLTPDEEVELSMRIQAGDTSARNELVQANLRFVISVAKQYQNSGVSLEDLINEGNIGLIRAAERFDPTRGFKFATFAVWWIRQSITTFLAEVSRTVRLPLNVVGQLTKLRKAEARFEQDNQRLPSIDELADLVDMPEDRVRELLSSSSRTTSLDAPLTDDSESTMMDVLVSPSSDPADAGLIYESLNHDLSKALDSLPEREGAILRRHFGLDGQEETLDEIAVHFHITRERVRQLREKAIRTLQCRYSTVLNKYVS